MIHSPHRLAKMIADHDHIAQIKNAVQLIDLFKNNPQEYRVVKFSQGIVYLTVSTSAFATQIRYQSTRILETLKNNITNVTFHAIQCKVSLLTSNPKISSMTKKNRAKKISGASQQRLLTLSKKINSPSLSEALLRLSNTALNTGSTTKMSKNETC